MTRRWPGRTRRNRALPAALALAVAVASVAACAGGESTAGDDEAREFAGETVTIFGPEVRDEQLALRRAFAPLEEATGLTIQLAGHSDFEERIDSLVAGGNPPDIAMFPQPGKIRDYADEVVELPADIARTASRNFEGRWVDPVTAGTELLAIPVKADFKSVVWYDPDAFEDNGYTVPDTFEGFLALADTMAADGNTPLCLGLESDYATGWPLTDWVEEFLLRAEGPGLYDQWIRHDIPFDHPDVVAAATAAYEFLARPGYVFAGLEQAAARPATSAGGPLLRGDCMMYVRANTYAANWPEDTRLGPDGDIDAFYLPGSTEYPAIALTAGSYAAAFSDDPAVLETMEYLAGPTFARQGVSTTRGSYLSPNTNIEPADYPRPLDRHFATLLADATPQRFDASDLMPGAVGSGSYWQAAVRISTQEQTLTDAFAEIEREWPTD